MFWAVTDQHTLLNYTCRATYFFAYTTKEYKFWRSEQPIHLIHSMLFLMAAMTVTAVPTVSTNFPG
jgi:hypothetical protein